MTTIRIKHRYCPDIGERHETPSDLIARSCDAATRCVHGEREREAATNDQARVILGALIDRMLARGLLDSHDIAAIFDDLDEWEVAP